MCEQMSAKSLKASRFASGNIGCMRWYVDRHLHKLCNFRNDNCGSSAVLVGICKRPTLTVTGGRHRSPACFHKHMATAGPNSAQDESTQHTTPLNPTTPTVKTSRRAGQRASQTGPHAG